MKGKRGGRAHGHPCDDRSVASGCMKVNRPDGLFFVRQPVRQPPHGSIV
ncbi:hypothetical protein RSPO_c01612 [Ralstonia solanacearum Po82]|uniref:Uncharacterized protein n=1 Tax=Ralstonia solanacearum (strain Po82) TaxID=1031711 RepID=F6G1A7_RALS8|nr:hypothetical protein RSPO_c01612 [Ralstonia solanacearum Po82]